MAFDLNNILGNPVFLGSFGLSMIGWFVAFIGIAIRGAFKLTWFVLFYHLFFNFGIFVALGSGSMRFYRLAILTFLAVSISLTVSEVNIYIYSPFSEHQAAGAGFIFLTIVDFFWVFLFGTEEGSVVYGFNTVATNKGPVEHRTNGLGTVHSPNNLAMVSPQEHHMSQVIVSPNAEYAYKAKALYDYQANPEDPNELSFAKEEILDIVDNKGKWWQAKKSDGSVGIAPSNYLQIF